MASTDWSLPLPASGRYHHGLDLAAPDEGFPARGTSLAPEIVVREMVRRSAARNLAYLQNNVLSEFEMDLSRMLDISDPPAVGLTAADLTNPDHQPCLEPAAAAMARRRERLLAPSAVLPGLNLVVLPRNLPEPPHPHPAAPCSRDPGLLKSSGRAPRARIVDARPVLFGLGRRRALAKTDQGRSDSTR